MREFGSKESFMMKLSIILPALNKNNVECINQFAEQNARARLTMCPDNLGSASSDLTGYRNATGDITAMVDSDGQHHLSDLPLRLIKLEERIKAVLRCRKDRQEAGASEVIIDVSGGLLLNWAKAFQYLLGLEQDPATVVAGRAKAARRLRSERWLRYHQLGEQ